MAASLISLAALEEIAKLLDIKGIEVFDQIHMYVSVRLLNSINCY